MRGAESAAKVATRAASHAANVGTEVFDRRSDQPAFGWGFARRLAGGIGAARGAPSATSRSATSGLLVNSVTENRARSPEDHSCWHHIPADSHCRMVAAAPARSIITSRRRQRSVERNFQPCRTLWRSLAGQRLDYINVSARPRSGLVLRAVSTREHDKITARSAAPIPEGRRGAQSPTTLVHTSSGWVTRLTGLGTYTVRSRRDVAGKFRSDKAATGRNWRPQLATRRMIGVRRVAERR